MKQQLTSEDRAALNETERVASLLEQMAERNPQLLGNGLAVVVRVSSPAWQKARQLGVLQNV